jgi:hypothetical protein
VVDVDGPSGSVQGPFRQRAGRIDAVNRRRPLTAGDEIEQ